jgi:hypothetical protein
MPIREVYARAVSMSTLVNLSSFREMYHNYGQQPSSYQYALQVYKHIHIHTYTYTHTHIHTYIHIHTLTHIHTHSTVPTCTATPRLVCPTNFRAATITSHAPAEPSLRLFSGSKARYLTASHAYIEGYKQGRRQQSRAEQGRVE